HIYSERLEIRISFLLLSSDLCPFVLDGIGCVRSQRQDRDKGRGVLRIGRDVMNGWYLLGALFYLPRNAGNEYSEYDACQRKEDRLIGRSIDDERHRAQHS